MSAIESRRIPNGDPAGRAWREAPVATLPLARRLRNVFAGKIIVDTTNALIVFEHDHLPVYYVPVEDIDESFLVATDTTTHCPRKGDASYWSIVVGDRTATDAVWGYETNLVEGAPDLSGYRAFFWNELDHWYEEDEEVFVHARDPFKRIDALRSSRHVRVEIDGVTVAETRRPVLLFETGIATRHYIPRADVRLDLLQATEKVTGCPYKGRANYYSAHIDGQVSDDIAWTYSFPVPELPKVEQHIAFFDEHVDTYVDGELQPRPQSAWS